MSKADPAARVPGTRPEPPANLSPSQARIWQNVVATKPVGSFDAGSFPVLGAYCVLVDALDNLQKPGVGANSLQGQLPLGGLQRPGGEALSLQKLLQLTGQIARLATALRLTPQARYDPMTAHRGAKKLKGTRPWD